MQAKMSKPNELIKDRVQQEHSVLDLNEEQVEKLSRRLFEILDRENRGYLKKEDFREYAFMMAPYVQPGTPFCPEAFDKGFSKIDYNQDGKINLQELQFIVLKITKKRRCFRATKMEHDKIFE